LGSLKQVPSNPLPKENTRLNSHFNILTQNYEIMSLVFYLKTIGRNVDPSARIMFPKSDLSLDSWILIDQEKIKEKIGKILQFPDCPWKWAHCILKWSVAPLFSSFLKMPSISFYLKCPSCPSFIVDRVCAFQMVIWPSFLITYIFCLSNASSLWLFQFCLIITFFWTFFFWFNHHLISFFHLFLINSFIIFSFLSFASIQLILLFPYTWCSFFNLFDLSLNFLHSPSLLIYLNSYFLYSI